MINSKYIFNHQIYQFYRKKKVMQEQPEIIREQVKRSDGGLNYRNYKKIELLGRGGFADCYEVELLEDKKKYALKIIPKKLIEKSQSRQKMMGEINVHRTAKHKNIVELERVFQDEKNVYMVLQLCSNNSLFFMLGSRKRLTVSQTQYYIYQLISALCYLHSHNIVHRDIKLGNLLLDEKMNLKLGDFGLATKILFPGDRKHSLCGTPNYIAPEVISSGLNVPKSHSGHSFQVDIWSVGIVIYILLIGDPPFETNNRLQTYKKVIEANFQFPKWFRVQSAKDLIRNILVPDPFKRYTFQQILNHPFMNPVNGIPKSMPVSSLKVAPKFKQYQKYQEQQQIKQSAKTVSITNIRPNPYMKQQQLPNDQSPLVSDRITTNRFGYKSKEKNVNGLLRSVFSATSLPKSLQKLNRLEKCMSSNNIQVQLSPNKQYYSKKPNDLKNTNKKQQRQSAEVVYIRYLEKQIIWVYVLNNGIIGTYQSSTNNYKIIYNRFSSEFIEIVDDKISNPIKSSQIMLHENIANRLKFMEMLANKCNVKQGIDINNNSPPCYLKKAYEIKSQNLILFKLWNGKLQYNQLYDIENQTSLILINNQLILVEIQNYKQVSRIVQNTKNCINSQNKTLRTMYIKTKKILQKISTIQKKN